MPRPILLSSLPSHDADPNGLDETAYDAFLDALERGEAPDVDVFLVGWPGVSDDLRRQLVALQKRLGAGIVRPAKIGELEVTGVLGAGGMGEVYSAHDAALDRNVAVKVLIPALAKNPARVERLRNEARVLAALDHPNVATVFALGGAESESLHIVMELVDGQDLSLHMRQHASDWRGALGILEQIASALAAAHDRKIIHRDLKPSNVMLRPDGQVKVLDFGLSSRISGTGTDAAPTPSSDGTPGYMSPEQSSGAPQDERTDVWAFGCIAHELLARTRAGEGRPLSFPADIPLPLTRLVERCLHLDRDQRPAGGATLVDELNLLRASLGAAEAPLPALPMPRTRFIGREHELRRTTDALVEARLVTLVGPGGVGKTRLALESAAALVAARGGRVDTAPSGAHLVELGAAGPSSVDALFLRSVGARATPNDDGPVDALARRFRGTPSLVVVDNCEHVIGPVARLLDELLARCPDVRVLATSREPLGVPGERVVPVKPLDVGRADALAAEPLRPVDAVALFVDRARAAGCQEFQTGADGRIDPAVMTLTKALCERLDGLPLAIEIAASRAATLGLEALVDRAGRSLALLTSEEGASAARHASVEGAIRWSFDLLSEEDRSLLERLSLFQGAWTLGTLEAMVAREPITVSHGGSAGDVLDGLARLTRRSLVVREPSGSRWRLLETVRTFARAALETRPAARDAARDAYALTFLELGDRVAEMEFGDERAAAFLDLEAQLDDFLAAVDHAAANERFAERAAVVVCGLFDFWISRGLLELGDRVGVAALDAAPDLSLEARTRCILSLGTIAHRRGSADLARERLERAVALAETIGDIALIASAVRNLAFFALAQGLYDEADAGLHRALELELTLGDSRRNKRRIGNLYNDLGVLAIYQGRVEEAAEHYERGLALRRAAGDLWGIASSLGNLGEVRHRMGALELARPLLTESLIAFHDLGDLRSVAESFEMSSSLELTVGDLSRAARLSGAADGLRERFGFPKPSAEAGPYAEGLAELAKGLGSERLAELRAEGTRLSVPEAIELAVSGG